MIRDARIFYVNTAAGEDLGYTREELVGMSIPDIGPDSSHKGWPLYWEGLRNARSTMFCVINSGNARLCTRPGT
jgi:PAS domain S-box-containing protein